MAALLGDALQAALPDRCVLVEAELVVSWRVLEELLGHLLDSPVRVRRGGDLRQPVGDVASRVVPRLALPALHLHPGKAIQVTLNLRVDGPLTQRGDGRRALDGLRGLLRGLGRLEVRLGCLLLRRVIKLRPDRDRRDRLSTRVLRDRDARAVRVLLVHRAGQAQKAGEVEDGVRLEAVLLRHALDGELPAVQRAFRILRAQRLRQLPAGVEAATGVDDGDRLDAEDLREVVHGLLDRLRRRAVLAVEVRVQDAHRGHVRVLRPTRRGGLDGLGTDPRVLLGKHPQRVVGIEVLDRHGLRDLGSVACHGDEISRLEPQSLCQRCGPAPICCAIVAHETPYLCRAPPVASPEGLSH